MQLEIKCGNFLDFNPLHSLKRVRYFVALCHSPLQTLFYYPSSPVTDQLIRTVSLQLSNVSHMSVSDPQQIIQYFQDYKQSKVIHVQPLCCKAKANARHLLWLHNTMAD